MEINTEDFPITLLFSGNLYDIRGLQFFSIIDKERFYSSVKIPLNDNELEFICVKDVNDYYIRYEFLHFICDIKYYHNWINNPSINLSNKKVRNIFYQFLYFPDSANNDDYAYIENKEKFFYRKILANYLLFNNDEILDYEYLEEEYKSFMKEPQKNFLKISNFEYLLRTFEDTDTRIIGFENSIGNLIKIPGNKLFNIINSFYMKPFSQDSEIYKKTKVKYFKFRNFESNIFYLILNITKLVIKNYKKLNSINKEDIKIELYNKFIDRNINIKYIQVHGEIKKTLNTYEFIFSNKFTLDKIDIITNNTFLDEFYKSVSTHDPLLQNFFLKRIYLNQFNPNKKEDIIQELKNLKLNHKNEFVKDIIDNFLNEKKYEYIKNKILNEYLDNFKEVINKYSKLNGKNVLINFKKDEEHFLFKIDSFNYDNVSITLKEINKIPDKLLNFKDTYNLFLIENNYDKCFNLNLNLDYINCELNILEILLEKGYGSKSKNFFRNDDNFYIHDLLTIFSNGIPNPFLILDIFKKLKFRKININLYNSDIFIIEGYESWSKQDNIDKQLLNNKNLKIYLEIMLIFINLNIGILNSYTYIEDLVSNIKNNLDDTNFKIKQNLQNFFDENEIKKKIEYDLLNIFIDTTTFSFNAIYSMKGGNNTKKLIERVKHKYSLFNHNFRNN